MLSDKVILLTGSGRGIGRAVAIELAESGATVIVNDLGTDVHGEGRSSDPAEDTVAEIRQRGGTGMAHVGDVTSVPYVEDLVTESLAEYNRIDGVANFAGITRSAPIHEMDPDEWDAVIDVHLRGHFALLRTLAANWVERGDTDQRSFLAVSSQSALGQRKQSNYSAAKAGILGLVRTTASELYPHDIRVNALFPSGYTRMVRNLPDDDQPFGSEVDPAKVAPMVGYVLSDLAEEVTGCTLRAGADEIALVSNPDITRHGFSKEGWSMEEVAEEFPTRIAGDAALTRANTFVDEKYEIEGE